MELLGYCVKCKKKRMMTNPKTVISNGTRFAKGTCSVCGTKMSKILGKK